MAQPGEASAVLAVIQACGLEMHERFGVPDWLLPGIPGTIAADATAARLYVVTQEAAGIIGTFALCDVPDDYYAETRWQDPDGSATYLHRFAVARALQSQGIGARCLRFMEDLLRRRGRQWLRLDATERDPRARAFYEREGYVARGTARIPVPLPDHPDVIVVCYEKGLS